MLQSALKARAWTWKDWQKATGMSRQNLWKVARGEVAMTVGRAARLAHALGTTVDVLLGEPHDSRPAEDPRVPRAAELAAQIVALLTTPAARPQAAPEPEPVPTPAPEPEKPVERPPIRIARFSDPVIFEPKGPEQNADEFRPFYGEPVEEQALAAAGDREVFFFPGGETPDLPNPVVRELRKPGRFVTRVAGDSMEPFYPANCWVGIEERDASTLVSGNVVGALWNGQPMVKVLRFDRNNGTMKNVRLCSLNRKHRTIRVQPSDALKVVGVVISVHAAGERRF